MNSLLEELTFRKQRSLSPPSAPIFLQRNHFHLVHQPIRILSETKKLKLSCSVPFHSSIQLIYIFSIISGTPFHTKNIDIFIILRLVWVILAEVGAVDGRGRKVGGVFCFSGVALDVGPGVMDGFFFSANLEKDELIYILVKLINFSK